MHPHDGHFRTHERDGHRNIARPSGTLPFGVFVTPRSPRGPAMMPLPPIKCPRGQRTYPSTLHNISRKELK
jgi:hypothetical protein